MEDINKSSEKMAFIWSHFHFKRLHPYDLSYISVATAILVPSEINLGIIFFSFAKSLNTPTEKHVSQRLICVLLHTKDGGVVSSKTCLIIMFLYDMRIRNQDNNLLNQLHYFVPFLCAIANDNVRL